MESHEIIKFQNIKFYTHPIYNRYAASKEGQIFSKKNRIKLKLNVKKGSGGYLNFLAYNENGRKYYSVSRFVYECLKVLFQMIKKLIILIIIKKIIVLKIFKY